MFGQADILDEVIYKTVDNQNQRSNENDLFLSKVYGSTKRLEEQTTAAAIYERNTI